MIVAAILSPEQKANIVEGRMPSVFDMQYALVFESGDEANRVKDALQKLLDREIE